MLKVDAGTISARPKSSRRAAKLFRSGQVVVRELQEGDAATLTEAANFRSIASQTAPMPFPYTRRHAREWISRCRQHYRLRSPREQHYALVLDDRVIGMIGAEAQPDGRVEIGYWLTPALWGRGIMTGVVRKFVRCLRTWWPKGIIIARFFPDNEGSRRVLIRNGFRPVAVQPRAIKKGRRWRDLVVAERSYVR